DKKECKSDKKECRKGAVVPSCDKNGIKGKPGKRYAKHPENRGAYEAEILQSLNLTQEQMSQIQALNEAREVSRRELMNQARQARENGDTTFTFNANAGKEINRKYLSDLKAVLTADQFIQFLTENYVNQVPRHNMKIDRKGKAGNPKRMAQKAQNAAQANVKNQSK
ncbi:MAG: hypothetical protein K2M87_07650, partial [Muribaculaceae bacterium]|nr:hypothetical protein [Muribaculaceae bacterium]